jgi:beta-aspartyl-dipeptidase (metallo-type)
LVKLLIYACKLGAIGDKIDISINSSIPIEIIDGSNKTLVPRFVDSHAHFLGGGGFKTRTPEINLIDITTARVITSNPATNLKLSNKGE